MKASVLIGDVKHVVRPSGRIERLATRPGIIAMLDSLIVASVVLSVFSTVFAVHHELGAEALSLIAAAVTLGVAAIALRIRVARLLGSATAWTDGAKQSPGTGAAPAPWAAIVPLRFLVILAAAVALLIVASVLLLSGPHHDIGLALILPAYVAMAAAGIVATWLALAAVIHLILRMVVPGPVR